MDPILEIFLQSVLPSLIVGMGSAYLTAARKLAAVETRVDNIEDEQEDIKDEQDAIQNEQDDIRQTLREMSHDIADVKTIVQLLAANRDVEDLDLNL